MASLIELHSSTSDKTSYNCNSCRQLCDIRYHCTVCDDYDLCSKCYTTVKHEHRMERTDDSSEVPTSSDAPLNIQQQRQLHMQRMLDAIRHAIQCRNANCIIKSCVPCQRLIQHSKDCTKASRNQCPLCSKILTPIWTHAKTCTDQNCPVRSEDCWLRFFITMLFSYPIVRALNRKINDSVQRRCKRIDDVSKQCIERKWRQVLRKRSL